MKEASKGDQTKEAPTEVRASPLVLANWPLTHDPHAGTKRCEDWSGQHFVILTDEEIPTRACNDEAANEGRAANYVKLANGVLWGRVKRGSADLERNYMDYVIIGVFDDQF